MKHAPRPISGFTLVEFSIVMVVVAIIIGGVIQGQELIRQARIKATIAEVQGFTSAYNRFYEKYQQLPGDMARATTELTGCTAANSCNNGNGDFNVGMSLFLATGDSSDLALMWWDQSGVASLVGGNFSSASGNIEMNMEETSQFWKHLALSNMIIGVDPSAALEPQSWGITHPKSAMPGSGYHVTFMNTPEASGHFLRLQKAVTGWTVVVPDQPNLRQPIMSMSPRTAWVIDKKIDDGYSSVLGRVWASGVERPDGTVYCENTDYQIDMQLTDTDVCLLMFKLD